ncbi:hypothetical protein F4677DRAFT_417560 [Hypoxylon crocopeplum]|nr:hypothetical protein F4677DRAFT_417560 [Hypoxylon crocopeplum]
MRSFQENRQIYAHQGYSGRLPCLSGQEAISHNFDSEEDDMYLFDIAMQQPLVLDPDHEFAKAVDELTISTLRKFLPEVLLGHDPHKPDKNWFKAKKGVVAYQKGEICENDRNVVIGEPHPRMKRHFACPFYIHNSERHMMCLTRANLRGINDVKQHLWNAHRLPHYCPTCREIFTTTRSCDDHIRCRSCSPREISRPEGISVEQMQQLARRAEAWMPEELQWLSLWAIVFPGADLPTVTYPSRVVESVVCLFHDFWLSYGGKIISDFLEEKDLRTYELQDEEPSLTALHTVILHRVIDRLVADFKDGDDATAPGKVEQIIASLRDP